MANGHLNLTAMLPALKIDRDLHRHGHGGNNTGTQQPPLPVQRP